MAEPQDDPFAKYADSKPAASAGADDPNDPFAKYTKQTPKPGLLESFVRGSAEGATFGFDDKLGMDRDKRELSRKANPWTHFAGEIAGGFIPMAAAAVLPTGVGQAATAGRAAQLAGRGMNLVRSAFVPGEIAGMTQAGLQGAKLGATFGTLSGAGHADVNENDSLTDALGKRLAGAGKGAVIGSVVGAPLGIAGHGVYKAGQALGQLRTKVGEESAAAIPGSSEPAERIGKGALVRGVQKLEEDRIAPQEIIGNILSEFPSASDQAKGGIGRRFWGDPKNGREAWTQEQVMDLVQGAALDQSPAEIAKALATKYGPQYNGKSPGAQAIKTMLAELEDRHLGPLNLLDRATMVRPGSGQNTQWEMRAAAATPGEARSLASEALLERQLGAQGRMGQLFDRLLGSADYEGVQATHMQKLQDAAGKAYETAFANESPFNLAPLFMQWQARFDKMRGVIPDTVRSRLDKMMWTETLADGRTARVPPQSLEGFMYAREGLRDLIGELPKGNNLRRHLDQLYKQMTEEVATTNPAWKTANDIWRDGLAAQDALKAGADMTMRLNSGTRESLSVYTNAQKASAEATEQLQKANRAIAGPRTKRAPTPEEVAAATPEQQAAAQQATSRLEAANAQQELFKIGLVRSLSDAILMNKSETANVAGQILLPGAQKMLKQVLGEEAGSQFLKAVRAEQAMNKTYTAQFGAQTTPLKEAVNENIRAPHLDVSLANPLTWLNPALQHVQDYLAHSVRAKRNTDLMRMYTDTNPLRQLQALREMDSLHRARTDAGNLYGKPVAGLAGPKAEQVLADHYGIPYQPARERDRSKP